MALRFFGLVQSDGKKDIPPLSVYNTLHRKKELFVPIRANRVLFYQCGPTVYWTQHIGNLRAMVMADFVYRTFGYLGYQITFVRNYTDVGHLTSDDDHGGDKMEVAAKREGISPDAIAAKYIALFEHDIKLLNIQKPDKTPRATEYIPQIIEMVQVLLAKGYAYSTDLAIYFDVSKAKDYTRLSGQDLTENRHGAGSGEVVDPQKKNPADFSIWFFRAGIHAHALQYWASPFSSPLVLHGEGFPGWHIECSAMIKALLGTTIDLHMGGIEHIPVHHTNEIAQSEAANDAQLAHYWIHNEWLTVNGAKMAKSEGTGFTVADIQERGYDPLALRFFFMQAQYRSRQNFTWEALDAASVGYKKLLHHRSLLGNKTGKIDQNFKKKFVEKISDDFNIPQGLALIFEVLKSDLLSADKLATILDFDRVLGLGLDSTAKNTTENLNITDVPEEIRKLMEKRRIAREQKNWQKSDELRAEIAKHGYELTDTAEETTLRKI